MPPTRATPRSQDREKIPRDSKETEKKKTRFFAVVKFGSNPTFPKQQTSPAKDLSLCQLMVIVSYA
jgi:hypothetical protein